MSFATKLCHVVYADGSAHDVMKHPATDKGKISLPGACFGVGEQGEPQGMDSFCRPLLLEQRQAATWLPRFAVLPSSTPLLYPCHFVSLPLGSG